jgi:hypothetical protein
VEPLRDRLTAGGDLGKNTAQFLGTNGATKWTVEE